MNFCEEILIMNCYASIAILIVPLRAVWMHLLILLFYVVRDHIYTTLNEKHFVNGIRTWEHWDTPVVFFIFYFETENKNVLLYFPGRTQICHLLALVSYVFGITSVNPWTGGKKKKKIIIIYSWLDLCLNDIFWTF